MSEYTPTTEEIRAGWIVGETRDGHGVDHDDFAPKVSAEFDRWLDQVKAAARREGQTEAWDEAAEEVTEWAVSYRYEPHANGPSDPPRNPYRTGADR